MKLTSRTSASLALVATLWVTLLGGGAQAQQPPQTGFEQSNGASWTTHQQELDFLSAVDQMSDRVEIEEIGRTLQNRPLQLVRIGAPAPRDVNEAQGEPVELHVCTQHGNEPAGREACLKAIRDLALTTDPVLIQQLETMTFLFIPTANPDGRNSNTRGNSQGVDINRDHLGLDTREARAIAQVVRDWKPDLSLDHHEYGPSEPVLYDDDVLYLWPRNLNVERAVHDKARSYVLDGVKPCLTTAGFTSDEYGMEKVAETQVRQIAGDHDEGIMRNTMGLRHSLGILFETAVSMSTNPSQLPTEAGNTAAQNRRRVTSHHTVIDCTLTYMRQNGAAVKTITDTAPLRMEGEGLAQNAPLYFGGADNQAPPAADTIYPPPCYYRLTAAQRTTAQTALDLHGISVVEKDGEIRVPLGQAPEPIIPLLLDARGDRRKVPATPVNGTPLNKSCRLPKWYDDLTEPPAGGSAAALVVGAVSWAAIRRVRSRRERQGPTG